MKVKSEVTQSCPTPGDPMDYILPNSSTHGIFQARILEWVVISFSRGSSWPRDWTLVSCTAGRLFTVWATREALSLLIYVPSKECHPSCSSNFKTAFTPATFYYPVLCFLFADPLSLSEIMCICLLFPTSTAATIHINMHWNVSSLRIGNWLIRAYHGADLQCVFV